MREVEVKDINRVVSRIRLESESDSCPQCHHGISPVGISNVNLIAGIAPQSVFGVRSCVLLVGS